MNLFMSFFCIIILDIANLLNFIVPVVDIYKSMWLKNNQFVNKTDIIGFEAFFQYLFTVLSTAYVYKAREP
jgi:hypothetical protein